MAAGNSSSPLVRLWVLRMLQTLGGHREFIARDGFTHDGLAEALGLEEFAGDEEMFSAPAARFTTSKGTPFGKASFGNWFRKACRKANVPGSAHGLRKAGSVRAAENGATEAQLNALFGWADGSRESATYTRKAGRAKLANAAEKLLVLPAPEKKVREKKP